MSPLTHTLTIDERLARKQRIIDADRAARLRSQMADVVIPTDPGRATPSITPGARWEPIRPRPATTVAILESFGVSAEDVRAGHVVLRVVTTDDALGTTSATHAPADTPDPASALAAIRHGRTLGHGGWVADAQYRADGNAAAHRLAAAATEAIDTYASLETLAWIAVQHHREMLRRWEVLSDPRTPAAARGSLYLDIQRDIAFQGMLARRMDMMRTVHTRAVSRTKAARHTLSLTADTAKATRRKAAVAAGMRRMRRRKRQRAMRMRAAVTFFGITYTA